MSACVSNLLLVFCTLMSIRYLNLGILANLFTSFTFFVFLILLGDGRNLRGNCTPNLFLQVTKDDCPVIFHDNFILTEDEVSFITQYTLSLSCTALIPCLILIAPCF